MSFFHKPFFSWKNRSPPGKEELENTKFSQFSQPRSELGNQRPVDRRSQPDLWSAHHLNFLPPTFLSKNASSSGPSPSPFPRFGHALSTTATAPGELILFGGYVGGSASNDLYVFLWWDLSTTLLQISGEVPSPRYRHAGARLGTVLLIWGGVTNISDKGMMTGPYDDSLYLFNIGTLIFLMSRPTLAN